VIEFIAGVEVGSLDAVMELINQGVHVEANNKYGITAFAHDGLLVEISLFWTRIPDGVARH
jgi:hypothetical protein